MISERRKSDRQRRDDYRDMKRLPSRIKPELKRAEFSRLKQSARPDVLTANAAGSTLVEVAAFPKVPADTAVPASARRIGRTTAVVTRSAAITTGASRPRHATVAHVAAIASSIWSFVSRLGVIGKNHLRGEAEDSTAEDREEPAAVNPLRENYWSRRSANRSRAGEINLHWLSRHVPLPPVRRSVCFQCSPPRAARRAARGCAIRTGTPSRPRSRR